MEATEPPNTVLAYYDQLLKAEPTSVAVWKRRISVLRRIGLMDKAVEELNQLLDTFYTDLEGWLELADLYSSCNQYVHAVHASIAFPKRFIIFCQVHSGSSSTLTCPSPCATEPFHIPSVCRNSIHIRRFPVGPENVPRCNRYG
jgi:hypothetical protein